VLSTCALGRRSRRSGVPSRTSRRSSTPRPQRCRGLAGAGWGAPAPRPGAATRPGMLPAWLRTNPRRLRPPVVQGLSAAAGGRAARQIRQGDGAAGDCHVREPGPAVDDGPDATTRDRRVGARLLPAVQERAPRVPQADLAGAHACRALDPPTERRSSQGVLQRAAFFGLYFSEKRVRKTARPQRNNTRHRGPRRARPAAGPGARRRRRRSQVVNWKNVAERFAAAK